MNHLVKKWKDAAKQDDLLNTHRIERMEAVVDACRFAKTHGYLPESISSVLKELDA